MICLCTGTQLYKPEQNYMYISATNAREQPHVNINERVATW